MKRLFSGALIALVSSVLFSGCSSADTPEPPAPDMELTPVHFNLKFSGLSNESTRSLASGYKFADGKSISVLKCYVYNQSHGSTAAPIKVENIDIKSVNENRGGDISILLPKGQQYDVVFLGTSIPQTNASSKLYYNVSDRTLSVDYTHVLCNDEELDCFYAVRKDVTTETVLENVVELTRPFAQLNVGAGDYEKYNSTTPIRDIAVSVDGIYDKLDLMSGEVIGDPMLVYFKPASLPVGQTFPLNGMTYLSMNYLLVNLRKLVDVTVTVSHQEAGVEPKLIPVANVAVERNYQTNLYGKTLLTEYQPEI